MKGIDRILYNLPSVVKAKENKETIYIVEGEKDADKLKKIGLTATTNVGGAKKWNNKYNDYLIGADIVVLPDNDEPGKKHALQIGKSLQSKAKSIKIIELSGLKDKEDVSDWLRRGGTKEELQRLVEEAKQLSKDDKEEKGKKSEKRHAADRLIDYALETLQELFLDQFGIAHALVDRQPIMLNSRSYEWLRKLFWDREKKTCTAEMLSRASGMLSAMAKFGGKTRELYLRSAWLNEALSIEVSPGQVVRVDSSGWRMVASTDVLFRRYANSKVLPLPVARGNLEELIKLLPLKKDQDKRLLVAYICSGLLPQIARPILLCTGAMGAGKTTLHRMIKRLLDPSTPETIRLDRDDALQKASHCAVVLCDNLSRLRGWQADLVCRLVTGEGDSKRKLYTDDDDFIIEIKRMILLNSINVPADRADFLDRALCLELERISDDRRIAEEDLWKRFELNHGIWLGAIFDLLSKAIKIRPNLKLAWLPRLADWGKWAAAIYVAQGWGIELFQADWAGNIGLQNQAVIEGSLLAEMVIDLMRDRENPWEGTASELLSFFQEEAERKKINLKADREFPKSPIWLTRRLNELVPALAAQGILFHQEAKNKKGQRPLFLSKNTAVTAVLPSNSSEGQENQPSSENEKDGRKDGSIFSFGNTAVDTAVLENGQESASGSNGSNGSKKSDLSRREKLKKGLSQRIEELLMITLIEPPMIGLMEPPKRGHFVVPDGFKF